MACDDPSDHDDEHMPELHIKPADRQVTDFPQFWTHNWLSDDALFSFRFYFTRVSQAFDKKYFKAGKRLTSKCSQYDNAQTKLARHNLIHYNYLIRQFHWLYGGEDYEHLMESRFFFP
jgi:hypothetical protein